MTQYLYDGVLSDQHIDWINSLVRSGYIAFAEVHTDPPHEDFMAFMATCPKHLFTRTDLMGATHSDERTSYALTPSSKGTLYGFKSLSERDAFAERFKDYVVDANPLKTVVNIGRGN